MKKVITYGTFDLFHNGHYNILKRAKELGDYLIVGVTGESYDMERGKLSVKDNLVTRIEHVKDTGFADKIIVEEYLGQKIQDIINYDVDVLVVGSDWRGKFDHMRKYCEVVYLERTKDISSTILRQEHYSIKKIGIVTDSINDNDAVLESQYVSGVHAESVFCSNQETAVELKKKYELDSCETDYDAFLAGVDIVYIKTSLEKRYDYIKKALVQGKHVISEPAITLDPQKANELYTVAKENETILLDNMPTLYLQAFNQLLWNARGNLIGDLVCIKCGINKASLLPFDNANFFDCLALPICVINKMVGDKYNISVKIVKDEEGEPLYAVMTDHGEQQNVSFVIEVGMNIDVDTSMTILGTAGNIEVPSDWWKTGYFKMELAGESDFKRYSSNFEGNGFRYILQSLLAMIDDNRVQTLRVVPSETIKIIETLQDIYKNYFFDNQKL